MPASRHPLGSPFPTYPDGSGSGDASVNVTPPPRFPSPQFRQTGYPSVRQSGPFMDDAPGSQQPSAAERSQALKLRKRFMDPYLQFTCGPLLRYDNVDSHGVWHGAALIVSAYFFFALLADPSAGTDTPPPCTWGSIFVATDAGSTYEPYPTLKYRWDPGRTVRHNRQYSVRSSQGVDLGPHPADPMAVHNESQVEDEHLEGPNMMEQRALGTDIYVHSARGGCASVPHVSTTTWLSIYVYISVLLAHTPFGDSSYRFSFPNMR